MPSTKTPRQPKAAALRTVTQAELQAVLKTYNSAGAAAQKIRLRIETGAGVHPGRLTAESSVENGHDCSPTEVLSIFGLDIAPKGRITELYQQEGIEAPREPAIPEWVTETPAVIYELSLWTEGGGDEQSVSLTRKEYIAAKEFIAKLRGYELPKEAA